MRIARIVLILAAVPWPAAAAPVPLNVPPGTVGDTFGYGTAVQLPGGNRWHFFSGNPGSGGIFFNVEFPDGSWLYSASQLAVPSGGALGSVLAYGVAPNTYTNPADGLSYLGVMYFTAQTGQDTQNGIAGRICLAFTNNGSTWTSPITAVLAGSGKTWSNCNTAGPNNSTYTEAVAAYHHSATEMHVFWVEGNVPLAQSNAASGRTLAYYATTTPSQPYLLSLVGEISPSGLYGPTLSGNAVNNLMVNLDVSAVPSLGVVLISRAYMYPSDLVNGTVPCPSYAPSPCPRGVEQFPNRVQAYCLKSNGNDSLTLSGPWYLLFDLGNAQGWSSGGSSNGQSTTCAPTPLANPYAQQNVAQGYNTMSQVKNPDGTLYLPAPLSGQFLLMSQLTGCGVTVPYSLQLYTADLSICQYAF